MIIELQRALTPEDAGTATCGICGHTYEVGSVVAWARTDWRAECDTACPECVAYLGRRNPERFPSVEDFVEARRRYPEPVFASSEEWSRAEEEGTFDRAWKEAYIYQVADR